MFLRNPHNCLGPITSLRNAPLSKVLTAAGVYSRKNLGSQCKMSTKGPEQPDGWSRLAPSWRAKSSNTLQESGIESARNLISAVNKVAPFAKAEAIHDIGCGNGTVIAELLKEYGSEIPKSARLVASDRSTDMITEAVEQQKQYAQEGKKGWSQLAVKILDATDMQGVEDEVFTHIVGGNMLYAVSDYHKVLSEVKRTLKPGGVFAYSVNADTPWIKLMGLTAQVRPDKITPLPPAIWHTRESCMSVLEDAGFQDVIGEAWDLRMEYDSPEEVIDMLMAFLPWIPRIHDGMTEEEIKKSKEIMAEHLRNEGATTSMTGKAVVVIGKK